MPTSRQNRNGYHEIHAHYIKKANQELCLAILDRVMSQSEAELENSYQNALARYSEHPELLDRDLAQLQAVFGGAE